MDLFQAAILAAIQGISAWIPVSSKTLVILAADAFFRIPFQTALAFALALHAGDLLAALYKYRDEYVQAFREFFKPRTLTRFDGSSEQNDGRFLVVSVLASAAVGLPAYLLFRHGFAGVTGEPLLFAVGLVLLFMAAITWHSRRKVQGKRNIGLKETLFTGAAQGLAVIPGISRSGITQCALLLQGVPQQKAMQLSFLMSAPLIAAAIIAFQLVEGFGALDLTAVALGIGISAITSLLTMDALTKLAARIPAYAFLAGIGLLAMVPAVLRFVINVNLQ